MFCLGARTRFMKEGIYLLLLAPRTFIYTNGPQEFRWSKNKRNVSVLEQEQGL